MNDGLKELNEQIRKDGTADDDLRGSIYKINIMIENLEEALTKATEKEDIKDLSLLIDIMRRDIRILKDKIDIREMERVNDCLRKNFPNIYSGEGKESGLVV